MEARRPLVGGHGRGTLQRQITGRVPEDVTGAQRSQPDDLPAAGVYLAVRQEMPIVIALAPIQQRPAAGIQILHVAAAGPAMDLKMFTADGQGSEADIAARVATAGGAWPGQRDDHAGRPGADDAPGRRRLGRLNGSHVAQFHRATSPCACTSSSRTLRASIGGGSLDKYARKWSIACPGRPACNSVAPRSLLWPASSGHKSRSRPITRAARAKSRCRRYTPLRFDSIRSTM